MPNAKMPNFWKKDADAQKRRYGVVVFGSAVFGSAVFFSAATADTRCVPFRRFWRVGIVSSKRIGDAASERSQLESR